MNEALIRLFESHFQTQICKTEVVPNHGSNRRRLRISGGEHTVIGVHNQDLAENQAFLSFSHHFRKHGLPVPQIFAEDLDQHVYLEQDLGRHTLFDLLETERDSQDTFPARIETLYERVVQVLPKFQIAAARDLNYDVCFPRHSFDRQSIAWDLNYFKYYFLKLAQVPFNEQELEDDFERFTDFLLQADCSFFLYRDFQSRNIMIVDDEPFFIDYQGGRRGALQYDIASLLFDAKANIPFPVRDRLLNHYMNAVSGYMELDREKFMCSYFGYVLVRIMQAMGAYGFRGFYERKAHFLKSVPFAIRNLEYVLKSADLPVELPALMACLQQLVRSTRLRELGNVQLPLTVMVQSFSFKRGLPDDETGHGGGFVFDCRALPNPGRLDEYKTRTGNDAEVIAFLEQREEVHSFLTRVRDLISEVVENYQGRNFTHLSVAFGCTGGQHRSVFCANQLSKFLAEKYKVKIELSHREQDHWP